MQAYYSKLLELTDVAKYEYWASFENFYDTYRVLLSVPLALCALHPSFDAMDDTSAKKVQKVTRSIIAHCARNDTFKACKTFVEKLRSGYQLTIDVEAGSQALEEKQDEVAGEKITVEVTVLEEKTDEQAENGNAGEAGAFLEPTIVEPTRKFSACRHG